MQDVDWSLLQQVANLWLYQLQNDNQPCKDFFSPNLPFGTIQGDSFLSSPLQLVLRNFPEIFNMLYEMIWNNVLPKLNSLGNYSMKICKTILYRFCNPDCPTTCMETSHDSSGRIIYLHDTFRVPYIYNFMMILIIYQWVILVNTPHF